MNKVLIIAAILVLGANCVQVKSQNFLSSGAEFMTIEVQVTNEAAGSGDDWKTVNLNHSFNNPVVIGDMLTYNGGDPCHIRLKNVGSTSFQFKIEEWAYLDGPHTTETFNFIVAESGVYDALCGLKFIVGTQENMHADFVDVSFEESFNSTPTVVSMCQTYNGGDPVVTRQQSIGASGFQVKLEEEEAKGEHPATEVVGFFAMEQGNCNHLAAARTLGDDYTNAWATLDFQGVFDAVPAVFVQMQTHDGPDTAGMRMRNLGNNSCDVFIEEEKSNDSEQDHTTEALGYIAIEMPASMSLLQKH